MDPWIHAVMYSLLFWAQSTIKNPKSIERYRGIIAQVYEALGALLHSLPPPPPTTPAPPTYMISNDLR